MKHSRIITEDLVKVVRDSSQTEARGISLANDIHSSTLITHDLHVKKGIQNEIIVYQVQWGISTCTLFISPVENKFAKLMLHSKVRLIDKTIIITDCEKSFVRLLRKTC